MDLMSLLIAVNLQVNNDHPFEISDEWRVPEVGQPADCEDYALRKLTILAQHVEKPHRMRIHVERRGKSAHAVAVVNG